VPSTRHQMHDLESPQILPLSNGSQSKQGGVTELQHVELRSRVGMLTHSAPSSPVGTPKGLLV
jgi:hypothetical protein